MAADNILSVRGITKLFPGTVALNNVSFDVARGQIHAIIGENGAGKSTLMKILAGAHKPDAGAIVIDGESRTRLSPALAEELGIRIVYQELNQVPELTVADNIFLGEEGLFLRDKQAAERARAVLRELKLAVSPTTKIKNLSIGSRQLVEIAKATHKGTRIIIMDEPTSSLSNVEIDILFQYIARLKQNGSTIIYISHKLEEILKISDTVTVLRDGCHIDTRPTRDSSIELMIRFMADRKMEELFPPRAPRIGEEVFRVQGITKDGLARNAGFTLRRGEILGFTGLMGCGRTELMETIFGVHGRYAGSVHVEGRRVRIRTISDAVSAGLGFVTEDRKKTGFVGLMSVRDNITLANLEGMLSARMFSRPRLEASVAREYIARLRIKTPTLRKLLSDLSGGNQQKVIISKWILKQPKILIMDEPTRGIDVGSKYEIYEIMNSLSAQGISIIFVSSEIEEIMGMCDRAVVMSNFEIVGELTRSQMTSDAILNLSFKREIHR
jgi:ABC-type sugar transport system ATPase subunit